MKVWKVGLMVAAGCLLLAAPTLAQDNLDGPWPTIHGDLYGRSRISGVAVPFGTGTGAQEAWRIDPASFGAHRPGGWGSLVFDADGNLYWRTTAGNNKLVSVTKEGVLRWIAQDEGGGDFVFGDGWNSTAPVIGAERVYALGAGLYQGTAPVIAAFDKNDGSLIWKTLLTSAVFWNNNNQCTPILYNGKLYVLGSDGAEWIIYQIDAATGAIDWESSFVTNFNVGPQAAFVPMIFPTGEHGLYALAKDTGSGAGVMFGFKIHGTAGATLAWQADGGKVARSHVIYNPNAPSSAGVGRLYTHTWNDYGATCYAYDPVTGAMFDNDGDQPAGGHGWYDFGAVDWDEATIVAGGFDGRVGLYTDNGDSTITSDVVQYKNWFGEFRVLGQLARDCGGNSIMISGTNSRSDLDPTYSARVVVANLTQDVHGPFDDGPLYLDDVKVWDGDMATGTLIMDENFDGYSVGVLAGQGGWVHDNAPPSGDDDTNPVLVVEDPTGTPGNKVAKFDAAGVGGGWQGVFFDLPPTTQGVAVIQWKQWRADVTDNVWFAFGDAPNDFNDINGWGIAWDANGRITPWQFVGLDGTKSLPQTPGVWETVTITYDFNAVQATIDIDGTTADPITLDDGFTAINLEGFDFQIEGTAISGGYNETMVEYETGVFADHGFTTRGGPLMGPDGKIYYFDGNTAELVALEPVTLKGDANCDGIINAFDIDAFILALTDQAAWEATYPCDFLGANDVNNDGVVNAFDIDPFIALLTGNCG